MATHHGDLTVQVENGMTGAGNVQVGQVLNLYLDGWACGCRLPIGLSLHWHGQSQPCQKAYTYLFLHDGDFL